MARLCLSLALRGESHFHWKPTDRPRHSLDPTAQTLLFSLSLFISPPLSLLLPCSFLSISLWLVAWPVQCVQSCRRGADPQRHSRLERLTPLPLTRRQRPRHWYALAMPLPPLRLWRVSLPSQALAAWYRHSSRRTETATGRGPRRRTAPPPLGLRLLRPVLLFPLPLPLLTLLLAPLLPIPTLRLRLHSQQQPCAAVRLCD